MGRAFCAACLAAAMVCSAVRWAPGGGMQPRTIVVGGKPVASIVLRAGCHDREREAAKEIQDYVAKASGATLPIVEAPQAPTGYPIRVEVRKPSKGESDEAFALRVDDERTRIIGNSPLAALYGAYELLERGLGVRWYLPGPLGEVVPKRETIVLPPLDLAQSPSFPMRWIGRGEWMLRNKQNRCPDGFHIFPGIYHTQARILPHKTYFAKRPDFFALIKGRRSASRECKLCYANPDCAREVASQMAAMLDANPSIDLISLSPTDGQMWCECPACKAMDEPGVPRDRSKSRRSLLFYNAVAAELAKSHPKARMLVGSYNVYNWPPKDKAIKAHPMIDVIITHYEDYCLAHSVGDPACPLNRRYVQLIKEWQALGCRVYFYEYYWKVNWLDLPWPIVHSIQGDMPWYKAQGCQGVYTQWTKDNIWTLFPGHYVAARLLWDVEADVAALVAKMHADLFGAAAEHMKAYYGLMEKQMAECGKHFPGRGLSFGPAVFTPAVRKQLRAHYQAAVQANKDDTAARRLGKIGTSLEYVDRLMAFGEQMQAARGQADPAKARAIAQEALAAGEGLVEEIRRDRKKWGGVVSATIVRRGYLARIVENWRTRVQAPPQAKPAPPANSLAPLPLTWRFALDPKDVGQKLGWSKAGLDDSAWKPVQIGRTWESQGYDYDGYAWYRTAFAVKPQWAKGPLALHFGAVDGQAWVYWNGTLLGHHEGWDEPFTLAVPPKLVRTDRSNRIAVRVYDGSNAGGIWKMAHLVKRKER